MYPLEYFTQTGVDQIQYPNEFWWQSRARFAREDSNGNHDAHAPETVEFLELDLGRVRQINYLTFSIIRAPIDISVAYDAEGDSDTDHRWIKVTPIPGEPFDNQSHYDAKIRAAWLTTRFYFTDSEGKTINARFLRIKFVRRDVAWPDGSKPFKWPIMVKSLRTARFINSYGDTLGTLFDSGTPANTTLDVDGDANAIQLMGISATDYDDPTIINSMTVSQKFGLPFDTPRGGTIWPNMMGFSVLVYVEQNEPTKEFDIIPNESLVTMQWSLYDISDRTSDGTLLMSGIAEEALTDRRSWINVYFDPEEAIATKTTVPKIYEVRFKSTSVHVNPGDGTGSRQIFGQFVQQDRAVPGVSLGIGTLTNGSTTVTLKTTNFGSLGVIKNGDIIQRVDRVDNKPATVSSISGGTVTLTSAYTGTTVTTELERVLPLTIDDGTPDYKHSACLRLWGDVGDSGRDVLGNSYRYSTQQDAPSQVLDTTTVGWMSAPFPSPNAVEALYFDMRTKDSKGKNQPGVIDAVKIVPRTPGVQMHVYYTNKHIDSVKPHTTSQWDRLIWTPVNVTYTLNGAGTYTLPTTIKAGFIKLEFSKLQPRPIQVPDKPDMPSATYRRYPTWIENQFDNSAVKRTVEDWFIKQSGQVKIDALKFMRSPILEFQYREREFLAALATNKNLNKNVLNSGLINTTTNTFLDPTTASNINVHTNNMFKGVLTLVTDRNSLLGNIIASNSQIRTNASTVEGGLVNQTGIPNVSTSNNRVAESFAQLAQTPMWFNREARHIYKLETGKFDKQAYYVGISSVDFLRKDFRQARDDTLISENLFDDMMIESNNWIVEHPSAIAARVGADTTVLNPSAHPTPLLITYEIDGIVYTDEKVTFNYYDQIITLQNSGNTQAINIFVYQMLADGSEGTSYTQGIDYDFSFSIDPITGDVLNNMTIVTQSARLVVAPQALNIDAEIVIGQSVISAVDNLSGPVNDAEIVIGQAIVGTTSESGNAVKRTETGTGADASKKGQHRSETGTGADISTPHAKPSRTETGTSVDASIPHAKPSRTDTGHGNDVSSGSPYISDEFTRVLAGSLGNTDTNQVWNILQGDTTEYSVNGALNITVPSGKAPIIAVGVDLTYLNALYSYTFDSLAVGQAQISGPAWWQQDAANYYRLTITQTQGAHTNLLVEQQIANINTTVPMDWGSGPVSSTKAIPTSQVNNQKYWCRTKVLNNAGTPNFIVKVWQDGISEPADTPGVSGTTIVGTGVDIAGGVKHGGVGFRLQAVPGNTNTPTYSIDNYTVVNLG